MSAEESSLEYSSEPSEQDYPDDPGNYVTEVDKKLLQENGIELEHTSDVLMGEGVSGEVFKGRLTKTIIDHNGKEIAKGTAVAVKVIPYLNVFHKYIDREIQALKDIEHSNVTKLFTAFKKQGDGFDGKAFLVMELAECSLGMFLACNMGHNVDKRPEEFAKKITRDIVNGLEAVHKAGWRHGDLHIGNVLLFKGQEKGATGAGGSEEMTFKWTDFGKSKKDQTGDYKADQQKKLSDLRKLSEDVFLKIKHASSFGKESRKLFQELIDVPLESWKNRHEVTPEDVWERIKGLSWFKQPQQQQQQSVEPSPGLGSPEKKRQKVAEDDSS